MPDKKLKIGLRGSALSMHQGELLVEALGEGKLVPIKTTGDLKQKSGEGVVRDKCEWIKEIEAAILAGEIDLGLHSGKDIPIEIAEKTQLVPILDRASPYDLLIGVDSVDSLGQGARVGTASLRRKAQLLRLRPDLQIEALRGNVGTRIEKLNTGEFEAIVLAEAGINRLGIELEKFARLEPPDFVPAVNQGILACQLLSERKDLIESLRGIQSQVTLQAFELERLVVSNLEADCSSSMGVICRDDAIRLQILSSNGSQQISLSADPTQKAALELTDKAIEQGARVLLSP